MTIFDTLTDGEITEAILTKTSEMERDGLRRALRLTRIVVDIGIINKFAECCSSDPTELGAAFNAGFFSALHAIEIKGGKTQV